MIGSPAHAPTGGGPARTWLLRDLRKLAAAAVAGLVAGFVVNGVGSRLAMMLLARLNPQVTGRLSDDGFRMGQFTLGNTAGLVLFGTAVGVLGGVIFLALRSLRFGPPWFQVASMSIGPSVVVGSMLIHTDGIDFHVLEPTVLAIGLFVALPGLFAATVAWLTDRWTRPDAWAMRSQRVWLAGLAPLVLIFPVGGTVAAGFAGRAVYHAVPRVCAAMAGRLAPNLARGALIVVFAVSLQDLVGTIGALV